KILDLPSALDAERDAMLRFELLRHLTFPPEDASFDAEDLPNTDDTSDRVLVVAAERKAVEQVLRHLEGTRLRPVAVVVACHELPRPPTRHLKARRGAWIHRAAPGTDIVFLGNGQAQWSRNVPDADAASLSKAIAASLPILDWNNYDAIWVSGDGAPTVMR